MVASAAIGVAVIMGNKERTLKIVHYSEHFKFISQKIFFVLPLKILL